MPRKSALILPAALAAAVLAAGCGGGSGSSGSSASGGGGSSGNSKAVTIKLVAENGSGENGTATLTPVGSSQTKVVLNLSGAPSNPQPAHIHQGTCAKLNPTPLDALQNVVNGKSTSTVQEALSKLTSGKFAINVHKSEKEIQTYTSCGNLSGATASSSSGSSGGYGY